MLILNRRIGETVMIGDDVNVTVLGVKGNHVRLGVDAPRTVPVHREEIYERIQRERAASAGVHTGGRLRRDDRAQDFSAVHDSHDVNRHTSKHRDA